jgi:hypothetical protein
MGKVLLAAAAYLVTVAIVSRGPLGLVRLVGPRLHQVLDLVLVVGLVVSPIFARSDLDVTGVIIAEALAVVLLRLALRTRYVPAPGAIAAVAARSRALATDAGRSARAEEIQDRALAASDEGGAEAPLSAAKPQRTATAGDGDGVPAARPSPESEEGGDGAPLGAAEPQAAPRRVPSTAWTLGVLAARAKRRWTGGSDRMLGGGARRLGTALGRANRRRSD